MHSTSVQPYSQPELHSRSDSAPLVSSLEPTYAHTGYACSSNQDIQAKNEGFFVQRGQIETMKMYDNCGHDDCGDSGGGGGGGDVR